MNGATAVAAASNPTVGDPEVEELSRISPQRFPAGNGTSLPSAAESAPQQPQPSPANGAGSVLTATHAAAAKAPNKATKKPLLDPEKYRKAKAPVAEEAPSQMGRRLPSL